jgi:uronate dehydrogenase
VSQRILITGAAGKIGTMLRPRLARDGRVLRLLDLRPVDEPGAGEEVVVASVTDRAAMLAACAGVDAVLHLGGHSGEASWSDTLADNIDGTYAVFDAARRAGVPRVVFASSNHAVGFHPAGTPLPDYLFPRPDTHYGVSKVAGEAIGSLFHDRYGLDVICLRIGACAPRPINERALGIWLSPDDCARLMEAAISVPSPGFRVVWGVSANTRGVFSLDEGRAIGYEPRDDSEPYAADVPPNTEQENTYLGGEFTSPELDT